MFSLQLFRVRKEKTPTLPRLPKEMIYLKIFLKEAKEIPQGITILSLLTLHNKKSQRNSRGTEVLAVKILTVGHLIVSKEFV